MEKNNRNILCVFASIVMLVAFFFLPLFSFSGWGEEFSYSMGGALIGGKEPLWICLLLIIPIYLIADSFRNIVPASNVVFQLPNSLISVLPLIFIVLLGNSLSGGSPVTETEGGGTFINLGAIGDHTGLGYYVYLAAAVFAAMTGRFENKGKVCLDDQKAVVMVVMVMTLCMMINSQLALFSMDRHTIFDFDEYGRLTLYGMAKGFGWIVYIILIYAVVATFKHKEVLTPARQFLISPKVTTIIITVIAVAALTLCILFAVTERDADMGPAGITFFLISLGLSIVASRNPVEPSDAEQETIEKQGIVQKKENKIVPLLKKCCSWISANSKKLGIAACALVVLYFVAWGVSSLLKNTTGPGGTTALMDLKIPEWTEFVNPTNDDGVRLYKTADANGVYLCYAREDVEGDYGDMQYQWSDEKVPEGYVLEENTINKYYACPIVGEEGDFYKIIYNSLGSDDIECFVKKSECRVVQPAAITQEVLDKVENMYMCRYRIVESGSLKGLVLTATFAEYDEPVLYIGELCDNCIVYAKSGVSVEIAGTDADTPYSFEQVSDGFKLSYGKSYAHEQEGGGYMFDVRKLTDDQIKEIYNVLSPTIPQINQVEYYIPDVAEDRLIEFYY